MGYPIEYMKDTLKNFVEHKLIDILISESEGRGQSATAARKMLADLYVYQSNNIRSQAMVDVADISTVGGVSYKVLEAELNLRGVNHEDQVEINLPDTE